MSFEDDLKYCPRCRKTVRYLESRQLVTTRGGSVLIAKSYCAECDGKVSLFSPEAWAEFRASTLEKPRPRGGRPRKDASTAVA